MMKKSIEEENKENTGNADYVYIKLGNLFPMRTSTVPKFIKKMVEFE
jgi:hypothetical protein